jgi:hypothetical protein
VKKNAVQDDHCTSYDHQTANMSETIGSKETSNSLRLFAGPGHALQQQQQRLPGAATKAGYKQEE